MIDITTGEIILYDTGFSVTPSLTPFDLEKYIPNQIVHHYKTDTNYQHYYVWLDIDPAEYVYAAICFRGNSLESIRLFPQYSSRALPEKQPSAMDAVIADNLVEEWYHNHFSSEELIFVWGSIRYFSGTDPIFAPPNVLIKYQN